MVQWPPSPSVEDEENSIAKEHILQYTTSTSKADSQTVPSQGSVDQYPVIVNSDTPIDSPVMESTNPSAALSEASKRVEPSKYSSTAIIEYSILTPPPSDNEERGRLHPTNAQISESEEMYAPRSNSTNRENKNNGSRPRPSALRLHTDIPGELHRMKGGMRRTSSPYAYTRENGTFRVSPPRLDSEPFLSPGYTTSSPSSMQDSQQQQQQKPLYDNNHGGLDVSERGPRKGIHFVDTPQNSGSSHSQPRSSVRQSGRRTDGQDIPPLQKHEITQPQFSSRRPDDRDTQNQDSKYALRKACRSSSGISCPTSTSQESSHSPLPEESVRRQVQAKSEQAAFDEQTVRHQSSYRHETPRLSQPPSQTSPGSSGDDTVRRVYYVKDGRSPMMPPTITAPKFMEDYFSQALEQHALRATGYRPRISVDESVVFLPPRRSPRTPHAELPGWGYVQPTSTSPRHASGHSSAPSWDEHEFVGLKAPTSLLSQATAAATIAANTSPPISRSSSTTFDTSSSGSTRGNVNKGRSRPQSPLHEDTRSPAGVDTFAHAEHVDARPSYSTASGPIRSNTNEGFSRIDVRLANTHQPQRNSSWTSCNDRVPREGTHSDNPFYSMGTTNTAITHANTALPTQRFQSAMDAHETVRKSTQLLLPACPRSQPTRGKRDWTTIRSVSNVDICPDCMGVLANTKFRNLFVRNPDKRHDQATVCTMSKPWARIALLQSLKQNKPDLKFVEQIENVPDSVWKCKGDRPDIRRWYKLWNPLRNQQLSDFYVCTACVRAVHTIFPELPDQFDQAELSQEKACGMYIGGKHFEKLIDLLDEAAEKCRDRHECSASYMQPFVQHAFRINRFADCARDVFLANRVWHYMEDLPEFTICQWCYDEVVMPVDKRPVARDVNKGMKPVPHSALRSVGVPVSQSTDPREDTHPVSCQLYSDRMRQLFLDATKGRISYGTFRAKVKERYSAQWRLRQLDKMYEEDRKIGWDRTAELQNNRCHWLKVE